MTVQETLQDLNDLFSIFDNPKDKFIQLMDMAKESEGLPDTEKTDSSQSNKNLLLSKNAS